MISSNTTPLQPLIDALRAFAHARDWEQFHTPKNLAVSIGAETGELLECFQWKSDEDIQNMIDKGETEAIADEIADIFTYLLNLCEVMGLDLEEITERKMEKNRAKYPVEKSYGTHKKYTDL